MDEDRVLEIASRTAREAGKFALERMGKAGRPRWKGGRDVVTPATVEVEALILDRLRREFPDHAFLSEEQNTAPDMEAESLWIIDPIDGSLNFLKGIPFFSVSIAFRHQGLYRVGVVYDPCRDELFHGVYRRGAYLNGQRIRTELFAEGLDAFHAATIGTDWPANADKRVTEALIMRQIAGEVVSIQILGSPALGLSYIAAGRLEAYFHLQLNLWDVAAGAVILEEGAGVLTDSHGSTWQFSEGGYLATNSLIHGWMLSPIRVAGEQEALLAARRAAAAANLTASSPSA